MSQAESTSHKHQQAIQTYVGYLPAPKPFHEADAPETTFATVRAAAMAYFGVSDYNDRDRHEFHLEHEGQRVDPAETLGAFLAHHEHGHKRELKLELVEQVTAGGE